MDVRNVGEHPGTFHLQINDHKGNNFRRAYGLLPDECFTIVINIEELAKRIDVAGVKAALFLAGRRPETNLRFQMGPLVTIPKDGADE